MSGGAQRVSTPKERRIRAVPLRLCASLISCPREILGGGRGAPRAPRPDLEIVTRRQTPSGLRDLVVTGAHGLGRGQRSRSAFVLLPSLLGSYFPEGCRQNRELTTQCPGSSS